MNKKYIIPSNLVSFLEDRDLALNTLKLTHGLIYEAHRAANGDTAVLWAKMNGRLSLYASEARENCGWASQRSNRPIEKAIHDPSSRFVFSTAQFGHSGQSIECTLQRRLINAAKARGFDPENRKHKYALLDMDRIAESGSCVAVNFYVRHAMHCRQDYPVFLLPGVGSVSNRGAQSRTQTLHIEGTESTVTRWASVRGKWLRAAEDMSKRTGDTTLFRHVQGLRGRDDFKVEALIVSESTKWPLANLFKTRAGVRYTEIAGGCSRALSQSEVKKRARGQWNHCPQAWKGR